MKIHQITTDYQNFTVNFTEDGWLNATAIADKFGKTVHEWIRLPTTQEYLSALAEDETSNTGKSRIWIKAKRGSNGGTWLHPDLAVLFARWLDLRFAIWCDRQVKTLITGTHPHHDWKRLRHEASSSYKVMSEILQATRQMDGKGCAAHHFSNEARLIGFAITGCWTPLKRNSLSATELDRLAKVETFNAVRIGRGWDLATRKKAAREYAQSLRTGDHHLPILLVEVRTCH